MTGTPSVACIGAGHWGKNLVRNFHELGALRTICETDSTVRERLSSDYPGVEITADLDRILNSDAHDAVVVATPAATHGELVRRALSAGKDVLVEKPLCLSVDEGGKLVRMAEEGGRILMVGHLLWYHPAVLKLKQLVDEGELGRVRYLSSNRLNLGKFRTEENILWSFAPHDISVMLGLVGEAPDQVRAHGANFLHDRIADVTSSFFSFPSGVKAHIQVSWLHPFKEQKLVVVGDEKMAVFDDLETDDKLVVYPHTIAWKNHSPVAKKAEGEPVEFEMSEPLRLECQHFLECVRERKTPRTDGREAMRVLKVLRECQTHLDAERESASPKSTHVSEDEADYFTHATSVIDDGVEIGKGTKIWHFSHVLSGSVLGENCNLGQNVVVGPNVPIGSGVKIQNNVSVYEGVTLEDDVFCGPSVVFTNVYNPRSEIRRMDELRPTLIKKGASLGANCTIVCGVTVGSYAFVGAGAVVVRDVPDYALVVGNPARQIGRMCKCGVRMAFDEEEAIGRCESCGRTYALEGDVLRELESAPADAVT